MQFLKDGVQTVGVLNRVQTVGVLNHIVYKSHGGLSSLLSFGGMKQGTIPVYTETLTLTNEDEGVEQFANVINSRVSKGIFLQYILSQGKVFF